MSVSFTDLDLTAGVPARLAVVAAMLALGACGNGDEAPPQTTAPAVTGATDATSEEQAPGTREPEAEPSDDPASDRTAITITLEAVLTGDDPRQVCGELVTDRYVREAYGDEQGCEAAAAQAKPAERVKLSRIVVLPDSVAQAAAEPVGGVYDGDRLRAELVLDEGFWKLDSLRSNVPVGP